MSPSTEAASAWFRAHLSTIAKHRSEKSMIRPSLIKTSGKVGPADTALQMTGTHMPELFGIFFFFFGARAGKDSISDGSQKKKNTPQRQKTNPQYIGRLADKALCSDAQAVRTV